MNRRQILKAFATVPVASALGAGKEDEKSRYRPAAHRLQILLDGAFAVVVQGNKGNSILAFSSRDKEEPHQFYFNDPFYRENPEKNYHFELLPNGLKKSSQPEIDPGFNDFHARTKEWHLGENFVTLSLPCPERITFAGHRENVVFKSGKTGRMPTNHILEYDVLDPARVKMVCQELSKGCTASEDSPPGLMRFFFEIGPPPNTPSSHAVNFFNYMLQTSFPELVRDYSLAKIDDPHERQSTSASLMPAVMKSNAPQAELRSASYTLDCKLGGMLVNTSLPPG